MDRVGERVPRLIYADQGYSGSPMQEWTKSRGIELQIVDRAKGVCIKEGKLKTIKGFIIAPKRWIVERTFAWLGKLRRLSKDYEYYPSTSETWIYLGMMRLMIKRIDRGHFDF